MALYTIKERRGTSSDWALANTVLEEGQWAYETNTGRAKIGDGATPYNSLPYFIPEDQIDSLISSAFTVRKSITNAQTGTSYTLDLDDDGMFVTMNNASPSALIVPPNISVGFALDTVIEGAQLGVGQVTLTPGSGVTLLGTPGLKIAEQYGTFGLRQLQPNVWLAYGRLAE